MPKYRCRCKHLLHFTREQGGNRAQCAACGLKFRLPVVPPAEDAEETPPPGLGSIDDVLAKKLENLSPEPPPREPFRPPKPILTLEEAPQENRPKPRDYEDLEAETSEGVET